MSTVRLDRLNRLIEDGSWKTAELAEALGTNYQYVYRLRRGDWSEVSSGNLAALARALSTSTDYLLGLTDDPRPATAPAGLTLAESRLAYEIAGAEDDVRDWMQLYERLTPEQRRILQDVAWQMAGASTSRIVGQAGDGS